MKAAFADTFYFLSLLDSSQARHAQATELARDQRLQIVTTEWVLAEFGDAYSRPDDRQDFVSFYYSLIDNPRVKIIPAESCLFKRGVDFFGHHQDKNWSLTDCLSFICMTDEAINEALTGDKHFEQAGFIALLK